MDFPNMPVYTVPVGKSKVDILRRNKIDLFLDDSIRNFEEINDAGYTTCILVTRTHNEDYDAKGLRVDSLSDFENKINKWTNTRN
jgi:hypothetical protein